MQLSTKKLLPIKRKMPDAGNSLPSHSHRRRQQTTRNVCRTKGTFKTRYLNHTSSFRNEKHKNSTELNKYVWTLKESNVLHSITWKIIKRRQPYSSQTKRCNLCLYEKFIIICLFNKYPLLLVL